MMLIRIVMIDIAHTLADAVGAQPGGSPRRRSWSRHAGASGAVGRID
jgi:hypothetical protein